MVNKTTAQKAIVAALSGMMAIAPIAPAFAAGRIGGEIDSDDSIEYWDRLSGDTRYDTNKAIIEELYSTNEGGNVDSDGIFLNVNTAIVVSGENWPDALAASTLSGSFVTSNNATVKDAYYLPAPIVITEANKVTDQAKAVLEGMDPQNVLILGGENTISASVQTELEDLGYDVERIAGADRMATSVKALDYVNKYSGNTIKGIIIASGQTYADALSIAPVVIDRNYAIVFTNANGTLTDDAVDTIDALASKYTLGANDIWVVGGENSVSNQVFAQLGAAKYLRDLTINRVAGANRYATSAAIAEKFYDFDVVANGSDGVYGVVVASGKDGKYADALGGAVLAAALNDFDKPVYKGSDGVTFSTDASPLLLVDSDKSASFRYLDNALVDWTAKDADTSRYLELYSHYILGGENTISATLADSLDDLSGQD